MGKLKEKWNSIPITVKASTSYTICNIIQRCLSFITLPLFTRLLTTTEYGQSTVYSSWSGILGLFLTLNLQYGSFATAMTKFEDRRDEYIASVQGICLMLSAIFLAIYLPFCAFWNTLLEMPTIMVLALVAENICATATSFWSEKQRFEFKYKSVVAVSLGLSFASPILALILVYATDNNKGYAKIIGYVIVAVLVGTVIFIKEAIRGKRLFNKEFWKFALSFNIPLIPYYLSQSIFNQSDRIMIAHYVGEDKAAIYGVAYTLSMVLNFVLGAINASYVPWFYMKIKEGKEEENKGIATGITLIMAFLLMGVIALAPEVILIFAGEPYMEAIWIVPPVATSLLLLFYSQLFINVEFYYEKKWFLVFASIGAALLNIGLNAWLIPAVSYIAAGYTTMASYIAFVIANYIATKATAKKENFKLSRAYDYKGLIIILLIFCGLSALCMALYNLSIVRWCIVAGVLIAAIIFRKKISAYVKSIIKREG